MVVVIYQPQASGTRSLRKEGYGMICSLSVFVLLGTRGKHRHRTSEPKGKVYVFLLQENEHGTPGAKVCETLCTEEGAEGHEDMKLDISY